MAISTYATLTASFPSGRSPDVEIAAAAISAITNRFGPPMPRTAPAPKAVGGLSRIKPFMNASVRADGGRGGAPLGTNRRLRRIRDRRDQQGDPEYELEQGLERRMTAGALLHGSRTDDEREEVDERLTEQEPAGEEGSVQPSAATLEHHERGGQRERTRRDDQGIEDDVESGSAHCGWEPYPFSDVGSR